MTYEEYLKKRIESGEYSGKAMIELGSAIAQGFERAARSMNEFGTAYRIAMLMGKKTMRPIKKMQHYSKYSKKARIRKKYQKRLAMLYLK